MGRIKAIILGINICGGLHGAVIGLSSYRVVDIHRDGPAYTLMPNMEVLPGDGTGTFGLAWLGWRRSSSCFGPKFFISTFRFPGHIVEL